MARGAFRTPRMYCYRRRPLPVAGTPTQAIPPVLVIEVGILACNQCRQGACSHRSCAMPQALGQSDSSSSSTGRQHRPQTLSPLAPRCYCVVSQFGQNGSGIGGESHEDPERKRHEVRLRLANRLGPRRTGGGCQAWSAGRGGDDGGIVRATQVS